MNAAAALPSSPPSSPTSLDPLPPLWGRTWSVAALCLALKQALQARFNPVSVQGEISAFSRASSGHCYFNLRDENGSALLRCAMFRRAAQTLPFAPRDGLRVQVLGQIGVYEARGDLQLAVERMQLAGQGVLLEQFMQLKAQLEAEGLFDPERKRAIPQAPLRIGVASSRQAAALEDVLATLARRVPHIAVVVAPARVQGAGAAQELVQALARLQAAQVSVILLVRGGGSLEDLWAFNEVDLVRAVAASSVPLISGVGHETDVSLCDFAADLRAPTPTAAAELCARSLQDWQAQRQELQRQLQRAMQGRLQDAAQQLDQVSLRLAQPSRHVRRARQWLRQLEQQLRYSVQRSCEREQHQWQRLQDRLQMLSPQQVLERGYAFLQDESLRIVRSANQVHGGQHLNATLAQGQIQLQVL